MQQSRQVSSSLFDQGEGLYQLFLSEVQRQQDATNAELGEGTVEIEVTTSVLEVLGDEIKDLLAPAPARGKVCVCVYAVYHMCMFFECVPFCVLI